MSTAQTELFLAVTVLSFLVAFVFSLLVEAPTLAMENVLLSGGPTLDKKVAQGPAREENDIKGGSTRD